MPKRIVVILCIMFLVPSCAEKRRLNVVLISVDTLRHDHLGYNGGREGVSPAIDRLAGESVVFPNAYSVSGWTLPSMATIITGRQPREHGAVDFGLAMDENLPTMATLLREAGYETAAFVSHLLLTRRFGFDQGFDVFDHSVLDVGHPHEITSSAPLTQKAMNYLATATEPFFLWVHYFDPHTEYLEHDRYKSFGDGDIDRYDQEIAFTDENVGRLLEVIDRTAGLDNTVVIFTADHGEEFDDHGGTLHFTLFEEIVRVPFLVRVPGETPRTDERPVEQVDVLPTVLSLLDIDGPDGLVLSGLDVIGSSAVERPVVFERNNPPLWQQRGILDWPHKLTVIEVSDTARVNAHTKKSYGVIKNVVPGIYLYDVVADPGESTNLYDEDDPMSRELLIDLAKQFTGVNTPTRRVKIDKSLDEKLRSLGYIR